MSTQTTRQPVILVGFWCLVLFLFAQPLQADSEGGGRGDLEECVAKLQNTLTAYRGTLPYWFFSLDRKLHALMGHTPYLIGNANFLLQKPTVNRYLVGNAVIGCHTHRQALIRRIEQFLWLCLCVFAMVLTLVIRIVSMRRREGLSDVSKSEPEQNEDRVTHQGNG